MRKKFPSADLTPIFDLLAFHAEFFPLMKLPKPVCADPDDDMFLACALVGRVKTIISGDKHLLDVSGHQGIEAIKPGPFVKKYI